MGEKVQMKVLCTFVSCIRECTHSTNARRLFRKVFKLSLNPPNQTRWWSWYELVNDLSRDWTLVRVWVDHMISEEVCTRTVCKMKVRCLLARASVLFEELD